MYNDEFNDSFYELLKGQKAMWQYPHFFDTKGFQGMRQEASYKAAEKMVSQVRRIVQSEALSESMFAETE